jgi:hypothetical protein
MAVRPDPRRFELRLRMLQHAGFKGLFPYRPRVLMMQVRVMMASIAPPCSRHTAY